MSTKSATKSTKKTTTPKQAVAPVTKQAEMKKTTKRSKKEEQAPVQVPEPVEAEVESELPQTEVRQRRVVTRESYQADLRALIQSVKDEITTIRSSGDKKNTGTRRLAAIGKRLKQLDVDFNKIARHRNRGNRKPNTNSGFMKKVPVSKEMCKFAGWEPSEMRSRVEVTKWLCDYVRNHELRNPTYKKEIWPDEKLAKLLRVDLVQDKERGRMVPKEKIEYCDIQKKIQVHFPPKEVPQ
jgi:chromatin remodeling complex protein RSC6